MHMRTHSGEKPFMCEQCDYSCTQTSDLKKHMPKHTGEKPFACNQCNYSCSRSNSLKRHMLSHTGEKPFACKQCNYSCKQLIHLKKHMRKHSTKKMHEKSKNVQMGGNIMWFEEPHRKAHLKSKYMKKAVFHKYHVYTKLFDSPDCIILVLCNLILFISKLLSPNK